MFRKLYSTEVTAVVSFEVNNHGDEYHNLILIYRDLDLQRFSEDSFMFSVTYAIFLTILELDCVKLYEYNK